MYLPFAFYSGNGGLYNLVRLSLVIDLALFPSNSFSLTKVLVAYAPLVSVSFFSDADNFKQILAFAIISF